MDRNLDIWFIVVAAAATTAVLLQLGFLVGLLLGIVRVRAKIEEMRAKSSSGSPGTRELMNTARQALDNINLVAKNAAELTERIKPLVDEAAGVSPLTDPG
jgi:hypothetical protein